MAGLAEQFARVAKRNAGKFKRVILDFKVQQAL